jgi:tetratricopeptide (TPR) repeat protein
MSDVDRKRFQKQPILQNAIAMHQRGQLAEAEQCYREILKFDPDDFDAVHLLGLIFVQRGQFVEGERQIARALEIDPNEPTALYNRGNALQELNRSDEALASFDKAIAVKPDYAEAFGNRGNALKALKRYDDALASYEKAIALRPDYAEAFSNRGNALQELKRFDEALANYDKAIALKPDYAAAFTNRGACLEELKHFREALASYDKAIMFKPAYAEAYNNRGNALSGIKSFDEALASYDKAIALKPDYAEAFCNRGGALGKLKRFAEALASYDRALAVRPDYAEAFSNRGVTLHELKRFDEALASFDRALSMRPDYAEALSNRGVTLHALKRFDEALAIYNCALAVRPDYADALSNRGWTLHELKRFDEALASYDRAIAVQPDSAQAHWNKSLVQLLTGDLYSGWREHEWRWKNDSLGLVKRDFAQPLWLGEDGIKDKTILLHGEQGFGDTIQFCRYVPLVAARGGHVLLEVPAPLQGLMASFADVAQVVSTKHKLPHFDFHCPLPSLPLAFGTRIGSIPMDVPYLAAPPESVRSWTFTPRSKGDLKIGLSWSGRPEHKNDANRSINLRSLLPLLDVEANFVSLQKDVRANDAAILKCRSDLVHYGNELNTFSDTAAVISKLDLVISVDTSVAHLAGALAKPIWILLPFVADWRWLLDREDSPWYPTARLFRQTAPGDWSGVIGRVAVELDKLLQIRGHRFSGYGESQ